MWGDHIATTDEALPKVARTELGGVPVFWAEAPPPLRACLMFRTGRADESLARSGVTHLTEHLVLSGLGHEQYSYNGVVEPMRTMFAIAGEPHEIVTFFDHVTGALNDMPFDRLEEQRRILRTEAAGRGFAGGDLMKALRYGAVGHGLVAREELGLSVLDANDVRATVQQRFTQGNAAFWMTGPLPDELTLRLPPGERSDPPPLETFVHHLPAYSPQASLTGMVASFTGPRTAAFAEGVRVLAMRLQARLRFELGLSYGVDVFYEPVGATEAHVFIAADALAENSDAVVREFMATLEATAAKGATEEELTTGLDQMRKAWADPAAVTYHLDGNARDLLLGSDVRSATELLEEYESVTSADTAARLTEALTTAIVLIPEKATPPPAPYERWKSKDHVAVKGKKYSSQDLTQRRLKVIVGDEGISMIGAEREPITIYFESCAAVTLYADGSFEMVGRDGSTISIDPKAWYSGSKLAKRATEKVPADRSVRIDQKETEELLAASAGYHFRKADLAPVGSRIGARVVDAVIVGALVWLIAFVTEVLGLPDPAAGVAALASLPVYEAAFLSQRGQTPGKMMFGLKVTELGRDAAPAFGRALGRGLCLLGYGLSVAVPILALILVLRPLWDPYRLAVHDHVVKTVVLRE